MSNINVACATQVHISSDSATKTVLSQTINHGTKCWLHKKSQLQFGAFNQGIDLYLQL